MEILKIFDDIEWMKSSSAGPINLMQHNPPMLRDPTSFPGHGILTDNILRNNLDQNN